ncbi:MAG: selenium metabolism membrane protein YedE/FdhT [Chloroflexi bacterium]|nr:selenium metabolism membrane protein YedE/FdhT [Chloroflexota bacterium]
MAQLVGAAPVVAPPRSFRERVADGYRRVCVDYWPYWAATLTAAFLNILLFAYAGSAWGVTTEFTRMGGHILQLFGVDVNQWAYFGPTGIGPNKGLPWDRTSGWLIFGMFGGALIGSLLSSSCQLRVPRQRRRLFFGFLGGVLGGFGARLAMGCNLGSFFSAIPQFSLHGWLFMLGLFAGTWLGVQIALHPWVMGTPERRVRRALPSTPARPSIQPYLGVLGIVGVVLLLVWFVQTGLERLGVVMLFGVAFGLVIERGRICFTNAFRELWITRQGHLARALALAMMLATIGFAVQIAAGAKPRFEYASLGALIGGVLFGVGIVLAGGCETGWMYRSVQGYVQLWMAGLGTLVGTVLLAYGWDHWGLYDLLVAPARPVSLLNEFGMAVALVLTLAGLGAWYLFATWWETRPAALPRSRPAPIRAPRTELREPAS